MTYARGGEYASDATKGLDYQKTYTELLLGFIGFTDVESIVVEPTLGGPDDVAAVEQAAIARAQELAKSF